jgi:ABC-type transport system involved in multi-copper enzyme maturation permease subunit
MFLLDNPVLQRELLVNLRMHRAFVLLLVYVALLGAVVWRAWPSQRRLDLTAAAADSSWQAAPADRGPEQSKRLVNLFFLGQFVLMALICPSFAAGAISGEKERKTYEMLLAGPMRPAAIVLGKLLAALCHLAVLVFCSLPIVMLCLPLGGVSLYEVLATYVAMAAAMVTFGMICIAASSYFHRTIAALVVSYLVILPLSLVGVLIYSALEMAAGWRLMMLCGVIPLACLLVSLRLFTLTARRLLHPPDVGAEAQEVIDPELEQKAAVGLVIQSDQFPDKLFVPARRTNLLPDGVNPIYDKEMRSEIFGQGTLMLRLVIQLSMFLALPLMAVCFYIAYRLAPWYVAYVLLFNMLVGPVFSAGAVSGERERQTLDLLLTTILSPWQILSGKLLSSLRISGVLTSFLLWPLLLAWLLPPGTYWGDTPTILGYLAIIVLCSITTSLIGLGCSVVFRKTSVSMMTAYLVIILLFAVPPAVQLFAQLFFPEAAGTGGIEQWAFTSPFSAVFSLPLTLPGAERAVAAAGQGEIVAAFFAFYLTVDAALLLAMVALFRRRGRHWVA